MEQLRTGVRLRPTVGFYCSAFIARVLGCGIEIQCPTRVFTESICRVTFECVFPVTEENILKTFKDMRNRNASDYAWEAIGEGRMYAIMSPVSPPFFEQSGSRVMMKLSTLSTTSHKWWADEPDQVLSSCYTA